jgi:hypothetical protein
MAVTVMSAASAGFNRVRSAEAAELSPAPIERTSAPPRDALCVGAVPKEDARAKCGATDAPCQSALADYCGGKLERLEAYLSVLSTASKEALEGGAAARSTARATGAGGLLGASIGGSAWEVAFVGGLAAFVADRAEGEVVVWLTTELQSKFCEDGQVRTWFDETCGLVKEHDVGEPPPGSLLAAAMRTDLAKLPANVIVFLADKRGAALSPADAELITDLVVEAIKRIRAGDQPLEIIAGLEGIPATPASPVRDQLRAIGLLARHFGGFQHLVDLEDLFDPANLEAWVLAVVRPGSTLCSGSAAPAWLCDAGKARAVVAALNPLLRSIFALYRHLSTINRGGHAPTLETARLIIERSTAVLVAGRDVLVALGVTSERAGLDEKGCPRSFASVDAFAIAANVTGTLMAGDFAEGARSILSIASRCLPAATRLGGPLPVVLKRYLPLLVDLAGAKTSDDVRAALEASAAPLGSWAIKRRAGTVTFSITALVGGMAGGELLAGRALDLTTSRVPAFAPAWAAGLAAPIGVDMSFAASGSTVGVFASVFDVGALSWARITDTRPALTDMTMSEGAEVEPKLGLLQVLSPGLYLRVGIGKSPFTLAAGASVAPRVRKFNYRTSITDPLTGMPVAGTGTEDVTAIRVGLILGVDVTILELGQLGGTK